LKDDLPEALDDLPGAPYQQVLAWLHAGLAPRRYLEIGTEHGASLALARCASIAVDPNFRLTTAEPVLNKPFCGLYQTTSDAFFAAADPKAVLGGAVDFAFLDGMHLCEFLLRDFSNIERHCHAGSVVALHDCLPLEHPMAARERGRPGVRPGRDDWWTGDVWRTLRALRQFRPNLRFTVLDAPPSGLVLVDRLDPTSRTLAERHDEVVAAMMAMSLQQIGLARHHAEMGRVATASLDTAAKIAAHFGVRP
jgi:hypothetical protein